ncbi:MAG: hypothetical protein JWO19_4793 [Bryobacterales bacterium]|nr:hypothetical protein [Bryobacterales bacterium]
MNESLAARIIGLAVVALMSSMAALADLSENTVLQSNTALNLETGAIVSAGGDILWNGSTIAPQGSAKLSNLGNLGATNFNGLPQSYWVSIAPGAKSTPIAANLLVGGDAFVAVTNSGKIAKVLVTANSGGVISLQFTTFGVSAGPGVPTITQVLNNSSRIPVGLPNYGIAPSSLFVVIGSGLADPGVPVLQDTQAPGGLPLTLNGASLTVVVNNVTTHPALYYTSPTQLAAVLPAATPVGTGTLTVTYNGATSAPAPIQVVPSALGINSYSQLGVSNSNVNVGVATDAFTGAVLTFSNSGSPGQTIVVWSTGLGADPADSDTTYTSTPHAVNTPMQVYFGGVLTPVIYQGASTYPGVNVIIFTIPASVPTGCYVPLVAVTGTVISNVVTFPINSGGGACVDATSGLNGNQILRNTQDTLKTGLVSLVQTNSPGSAGTRATSNSANAAFQKYSGLLAAATGLMVSPGGCVVGPVVPGGQLILVGLDAGTITLAGPAGLAVTLGSQFGIKGAFTATLAVGSIPSSGGTFTFKGSGGADVGSFTTTITLSNPILTWTNLSAAATVDRTQGLPVSWTGGNPGTYVVISGTSTSTASGAIAGFTCRIAAEAGQFTVPSYILLGLPTGNGGAAVQNDIFSTFSATGLDAATAGGAISHNVTSAYR